MYNQQQDSIIVVSAVLSVDAKLMSKPLQHSNSCLLLLSSVVCLLGGSGSNGNNGIWPRWWREEDPYWPLRDWGDHPMRWWTWGLAGVMAGRV